MRPERRSRQLGTGGSGMMSPRGRGGDNSRDNLAHSTNQRTNPERSLFDQRETAESMTLELIAQLLSGVVDGSRVLAPGPGKPSSDRSLVVIKGKSLPAGLLIFDQSNPMADTWANRAHVCDRLNIAWPPRGGTQ